jgi:hypothetical protein
MNGLLTAKGTPQHQKTIPVMTGQWFDHDHGHFRRTRKQSRPQLDNG